MFNYNELLFNEKDSDFKILVSLHNLYCSYNYLSNTAYTRLYSIPFYHTDGWIFLTHSFNEAFFSKATDFFWLEFLFPMQISSPNHFFFARLYFWFWVLLLRSKRAATQNTQNVRNISISPLYMLAVRRFGQSYRRKPRDENFIPRYMKSTFKQAKLFAAFS